MTAQLRSELLKLGTTRTALWLLLAGAAVTLLGTCVEGFATTVADIAKEDQQRTMLGAGSVAVFFATLAGLLVVTGEFRYGTIRPTLLFEPRRRVVLAAKLLAAALLGLVFAIVYVGLSVGAGRAILRVRDVDAALTGSQTAGLVAGTVAASFLGGMLGVAIGALIRNQVGAIVALVAYAFLVDAVLFAALPSVGRFLPGKAGDALAGQPAEHLLAPGVGAAVLLAWTLAFVAAATLRTERSDI
jgi:ABC-type transport system involved in multi-copper enzyme maturation permease subunit